MALIAVMGWWGCALVKGGPAFRLSLNAGMTAKEKPADCDFKIETVVPQGQFEEVGILISEGWAVHNRVELKEAVRAEVCRVGGDVVVTEMNTRGQYLRATVLRWTTGAGGG